MGVNWKQRLSKIKDFSAAKTAADELAGGSVPDGQYAVKPTSIELAESQGSGREQINFFTEVLEGEFAGHRIGCFHGLDEKGLRFTIAMLRSLGFEIEEPEQIVDAVESLGQDLPELLVRVKNGYGSVLSNVDGAEDVQDGEQQEIASVEEIVGEIEVGSKVMFDWKGQLLEGIVKAMTDSKTMVSSGGKLYPVKPTEVELKSEEAPVEDDESVEEEPQEEPIEEEEETPKKKTVAKKPAPKKVIKKKR